MTRLSLELVHLGLALLRVDLSARVTTLVDGLNFAFQFNNFVCLGFLFGFKLVDAPIQISLTMLSLQLLTHRECNGAAKYKLNKATKSRF